MQSIPALQSLARSTRVSSILLSLLVASACGSGTVEDDDLALEELGDTEQSVIAAPIVAAADAHISSSSPAVNAGASTLLKVSSLAAASERSLLSFSQSEIRSTINSRKVHRAWVELHVASMPDGWLGGEIALHRMLRSWEESRATYACAADANPANGSNDCAAADAWVMTVGHASAAMAPTPSARVKVYSAQRPSTVRFEVTSDIREFMAGAPNHGFIVQGVGSASAGPTLSFDTRESGQGPKLVLEVGADLCPDDSKDAPGQCGCGVPDSDTDGDGLADCLEPALVPVADTSLHGKNQNINAGTQPWLRVTSKSDSEAETSILRFDQAEIAAAVGNQTLRSATLEIPVVEMTGAWNAGAIELFAMVRSWEEGSGTDTLVKRPGATWVCAADTDTSDKNVVTNCAASDRWSMTAGAAHPVPHLPAASSALAPGASPTVLRFNVTIDVKDFLSGKLSNFGWMLKGRDSLPALQSIVFGSRESANPPRLVLDVGKPPHCGSDYACTLSGATDDDTYVRQEQPFANFGGANSMTVGRDTQLNHALVSFRIDNLMRDVAKDAEIVSAKLILKGLGGPGTNGSMTLAAHRMLRPWEQRFATWACSNDTNPSATAERCPTGDSWSMTGTSLPYESAAATAMVTPITTTDVAFDVSNLIRNIVREDSDTVSWLIRQQSGSASPFLFGTREAGTPARLVLVVRPPPSDTDKRNARLAEEVTRITDPVREGFAWWVTWASTCSLSRALNGQVTAPHELIYQKIRDRLDDEHRAAAHKIAADLRDIPAETAAGLLGPFAGIDPRVCNRAPYWEAAFKILKSNSVAGRIRANQCEEGSEAITVGAKEVIRPITIPDNNNPEPHTGRMAGDARPVVIGIDSQEVDPDLLGRPELVQDWENRRIGPNGEDDGLSPWGVKTAIRCDNVTTYANDTCNHEQGLICGNVLNRANDVCMAFPIVTRGDTIDIRGHNFWDFDAQLRFGHFTANNLSRSVSASRVAPGVTGDDAIDCTPATQIAFEPRLPAGNHDIASFPIDVTPGFYSLEMFNRNGQYRTQADILLGREQGRTIHVCEDLGADESIYYEDGTAGTNRGCTAPQATCVQDGANCTAGWTTPPRPLAECIHGPTTQVKCGETPAYFSSREDDIPFVFVRDKLPVFKLRTFLNRVECTEETGCNHCGGEDEFELHYFSASQRALRDAAVNPVTLVDNALKVYRQSFNDDDVRHPERLIHEMLDVSMADDVYSSMVFYEEDSGEYYLTLTVGNIITAAAAAVATAYGGAAVGVLVEGLGIAITQAIANSIKGMDTLGSVTWLGNYWDMAERVDYTHRGDFMVHQRQNPDYLKILPQIVKPVGRLVGSLLHPLVGYGREVPDTLPRCGTGTSLSCAGSTVCYVNQCIGNNVRDGALTFPGGFVSGPRSDPTWQIGYRARYSLDRRSAPNGNDGFYKADLEFVLCPEGSTSSRCQ